MLMRNETLTREPVRPSPTSNTEINEARLPKPEALAGMELRIRGGLLESALERAPLRMLFLFVLFGVLYAVVWLTAPDLFSELAEKAKAIEGMSVVVGMLAVLLFVIVFLSLVFIPGPILCALLAISVPASMAVSFVQKGQHIAGLLSAVGLSIAAGWFWRGHLLRFHSAWLSADPRMSTEQAKAWSAEKFSGWVLPNLKEATQIIGYYLRYESSSSPGVWIPPSPVSHRVFAFGLFSGSIFTSVVLFAHHVVCCLFSKKTVDLGDE